MRRFQSYVFNHEREKFGLVQRPQFSDVPPCPPLPYLTINLQFRDDAWRVAGAARPVGAQDDVPHRGGDGQVGVLPLLFRRQRRPLNVRRVQVRNDAQSIKLNLKIIQVKNTLI